MKALTALVCATALLAAAGNVEAKTMYAGVKGGVNIATLSGDDTDGLDSHNGFIGGVFYGVDFGEFGVRLEGLYVQKGAEGPFTAPDGDTHESTVRLDYVEFPLLFTGTFSAGEKIAFNVFAGPTFGFNTTAELEIPEHGETEDISDSVDSFEFGAAVGGGVEYELSSFSIIVDARYSLGATSIVNEGDSDVKNRGIGVMAGVKFPLGAK
jgi:opacity protein-like surface antigen